MTPHPEQGDAVRFVHSPGLGGIVSSIANGEAMVCMPIGGSYQLRGPVPLADLRVVPAEGGSR